MIWFCIRVRASNEKSGVRFERTSAASQSKPESSEDWNSWPRMWSLISVG